MELTLNEFIEKTNNIEELKIEKKSDIGIYRWSTIGNNKELNEYITQQLKENIIITDCYLIQGYKNLWIKKEYIDNIVNIIEKSESYDEMYTRLSEIPEIIIEKFYKNDIIVEIKIEYRNGYGRGIISAIKKQIQSPKSTNVKYRQTYSYSILIKNSICDMKEDCKHSCKTQYKINKFNEIFNLGD